MARSIAVVSLFLILSATSAASAQPGATPSVDHRPGAPLLGPDQDESPVYESYKRSVITIDSVAGSAMLVGVALILPCVTSEAGGESSCTLAQVGIFGGVALWVVGSPIVHLTEGNETGAALSLLLRLGLPAAGLALTEASDGDLGGWAVVGGVTAAMLIDWLVLAKREVTPSRGSRYIPTLTTTSNGGFSVGMAGAF